MIDIDDEQALLPPAPRSVRETGLEPALLAELVGKALLAGGKCHLSALTSRLRLPVTVLREILEQCRADQLVEVAWRGDSDIDVQYQLSPAGRARAAAWLAQQPYAGPAPVPFESWRAQLQRQALLLPPVLAQDMLAVFEGDCLPPQVHEQVGAAMHAGRSLLLYGPSGCGKSTLARKLGALLQGVTAVPHAVAVGNAIMQVYDPAVHQAPLPLAGRGASAHGGDLRWMPCRRPVLQLGAELDAATLELRHDAAGGAYLAPPQVKASHGLLILDDLGRQRLPAPALLNRLTQLLDTGTDQLALPGGHPFTVPCQPVLAFATSQAPHSLLDGAALRRIGYKVALGPLPETSYRSLLRQQCRARGIEVDEAALAYLLEQLHRRSGQPLLASLPREIVGRVAEFAGFAGQPPQLSPASLERAWASIFAGRHEEPA